MIVEENDIIYNDDYMYFQYLGKKKQDEEAWRALHREDLSRYNKLRAKYSLAAEEKSTQILLEEEEGPILEKRRNALGGNLMSKTGIEEPKIKLKIIKKEIMEAAPAAKLPEAETNTAKTQPRTATPKPRTSLVNYDDDEESEG